MYYLLLYEVSSQWGEKQLNIHNIQSYQNSRNLCDQFLLDPESEDPSLSTIRLLQHHSISTTGTGRKAPQTQIRIVLRPKMEQPKEKTAILTHQPNVLGACHFIFDCFLYYYGHRYDTFHHVIRTKPYPHRYYSINIGLRMG